MLGAGWAKIECVCTFPPLVGLNPCQPSDGCTAEPVYLITTIINQIVGGSGVGGPNTIPAPAFIRFLCGIVCVSTSPVGRESHCQALGHGEQGTSCLHKDGEKIAGSLRHWICPIFGNESRVFLTLTSSFAFPFCRRRKGTVTELASTLPSSLPSPSSFSGKGHSWASLPASSRPPCNFFLSHTCPGSFLENCPPLTYI